MENTRKRSRNNKNWQRNVARWAVARGKRHINAKSKKEIPAKK